VTDPGVSIDTLRAARKRIASLVHHTPVLTSASLDERAGAEVFFKCENFQRTGSFKFRGAYNRISLIPAAQRAAGVVAYSSGNHAQGVAAAAALFEIPATIVMPADAPPIKLANTRAYGAEVVLYDRDRESRENIGRQLGAERGLTLVPPFDDPSIIAGQGTVGREMLKQSPGIDVLVVAIGGGGLISGVATAAKAMAPGIRVVGVEPVGAPTLSESLAAGAVTTLDTIETDAVTLAPRRSAEINLEIIGRNVDEIVLVSDDEMRAAARWLWFEAGVAAELSGAAAIAAVQTGRVAAAPDATVAAIVCGAGTDGLA